MRRIRVRSDFDDWIRMNLAVVREDDSGEFQAECPWCGQTNFSVNSKTGAFNCRRAKRCGERGGPVYLVEHVEGCSTREAKDIVRGLDGRAVVRPIEEYIEMFDRGGEADEPPPEPALELPDEFEPVTASRFPTYLKDRRISLGTAERYGLGFCTTGEYANRLIVPGYEGGELVMFQGRHMLGGVPKYMTPKRAKKSEHLIGYDQAIGADVVVLVEGPFDVLGCAEAGIAAVCTAGSAISSRQLRMFSDLDAELVVLWDSDAYARAIGLCDVLSGVGNFRGVGRIANGDPGDASPRAINKAVREARMPRYSEVAGARLSLARRGGSRWAERLLST